MSVASTALRHSRAAGLMAVALVVAGVIAGLSLPSSIYPPLEFPRIVIIAHSGTLPPQSMMLTVTRPIEQAVMEVPGIRRVRSTQHPRRRRDLGAVRPVDRHGASRCSRCRTASPRSAASCRPTPSCTVERLTPAVFPVFILSMTGTLPTADLNDYAHLRDAAGARARAGRRARSRCSRATRARSKSILDPAKLDRRGPDGRRRRRRAQGAEPAAAGRPVPASPASSTSRSRRARGRRSIDIAAAPVLVKNGATIRVARPRHGDARRARSHAARHRQRPRRRLDQHLAADRRQHPRPEGRRRRSARAT